MMNPSKKLRRFNKAKITLKINNYRKAWIIRRITLKNDPSEARSFVT